MAGVRKSQLRLWPGVVIVVVQWVSWIILPLFNPEWRPFGLLVGVAGGLLTLIWWLCFSRARWIERLSVLPLMVAVAFVTKPFLDPSIQGSHMGMMFPLYVVAPFCTALVVWAALTRGITGSLRWATMLAAFALASGVFTLVRTEGIMGDGMAQIKWRWTPSPEVRLLGQTGNEPVAATPPAQPATSPAPVVPEKPVEQPKPAPAEPAATPMPATSVRPAVWPGFRGPERDSVVRGIKVSTDWTAAPPKELWRRAIGPGWSSFAVDGDIIYTQEQRGEHEVVAAYRLTTGQPVWVHKDAIRFYEANAGAGPRATPSLAHGRIYSMGATGFVNALDARTGAVVWSRDAAKDTGAKILDWGFCASPAVIGDKVVVATSGRLIAYDAATGAPKWNVQAGGGSYSSPQVFTLAGVTQVLMQNSSGIAGISPADGQKLWTHAWEGNTILQPALTEDGDLLITTGDGMGGAGIRRLAVTKSANEGWKVEERWTSRGLKPYFNDFVVHKGHAYGFDGSILSCIDLKDGSRKWKGGRYGNGQMLLLADQDLLLVISEEGELALVNATPGKFAEFGKFKAIEGKTWNHPVLIGDVVVVRNGEEMAAFRLSKNTETSSLPAQSH